MRDTKDLIVNTAFKLFISKSYHEVTMRDIVNATGLSKGAFYHYFSSKEKVFEEVVNVFFKSIILEDLLPYTKGGLEDFCKTYVDFLNNRISKYYEDCGQALGEIGVNHYALIFDAIKLLPSFKERQAIQFEQELNLWMKVIERAKMEGEISSNLPSEQLAKLFIYQNYGIGVYHISRSQVSEMVRLLKEQFEVIYKSIS